MRISRDKVNKVAHVVADARRRHDEELLVVQHRLADGATLGAETSIDGRPAAALAASASSSAGSDPIRVLAK